MIKAVIFDMFETLVTQKKTRPYFGKEIAEDIGISEDEFRSTWTAFDDDRTLGRMTFEDAIRFIMDKYNIFSEELFSCIVKKRRKQKNEILASFRDDIIEMFKAIKIRNCSIGLISNCYSEEAEAIRMSKLVPFFDTILLSYEVKMEKPDPGIFLCATEKLGVSPEECLYIGDGGYNELEAANSVGMTALQAGWYLDDSDKKRKNVNNQFACLNCPLDVLTYIK